MTPTKPADEKKTIAQEGAKQPDAKAGAPAAPATSGATGSNTVPVRKPGRRAPGAKEVIPFVWKLIGTSADLTVTLFKAIEKVDVEAQLERLRRDGYYRNLTVLDVDAVVTQPVVAKRGGRAKKPAAKVTPPAKASPPAKAGPPAKAAPPAKAGPSAKTSAASASSKKKPSSAKTSASASATPAKKKRASTKSVAPSKPKATAKKTSSASAQAKSKKKTKAKATAVTKKKK